MKMHRVVRNRPAAESALTEADSTPKMTPRSVVATTIRSLMSHESQSRMFWGI